MELIIFDPFDALPVTITCKNIVTCKNIMKTRDYFYECSKNKNFNNFFQLVTLNILDKYLLKNNMTITNLQTCFFALFDTVPKDNMLDMVIIMLKTFTLHYNVNFHHINAQTKYRILNLIRTTIYSKLIDESISFDSDAYYDKILNVVDVMINCINNIITKLSKYQFSQYFFQNIVINYKLTHNIHIFKKFISGTINSISSLYSHNLYELKLIQKNYEQFTKTEIIICINYGYHIKNIFFNINFSHDTFFVNYVSNFYNEKIKQSKNDAYVNEKKIWLLYIFLKYIIKSDSNILYFNILVQHNFFGASNYILANHKFTKNRYTYLNKFFEYFVKYCTIDFVESLICSVDLEKNNVSQILGLYHTIATKKNKFLANLFLNKILLPYPKLSDCFSVLINHICDIAKLKMSYTYLIIVKIDKNSQIIDPYKIIQQIIEKNAEDNIVHNQKVRYLPDLVSSSYNIHSRGIGVKRSVINDLLKFTFNEISKHNEIQLNTFFKQKQFYNYGVMHAVILASKIINIIPQYMYNYIFGKEVTLDMVMGSTFVKNLFSIKELNNADLENLSLTMSIHAIEGDKNVEFELIDGGKNIQVTANNVDQYINLINDYYTFKNTNAPTYINMEAFNKGFKSLFTFDETMPDEDKEMIYKCFTNINSISLVLPDNMEEIITFTGVTDMTIKKKMLMYLSSFDILKFKRFLKLTTGLNYLTDGMKIGVYQIAKSNKHYPIFSVCTQYIYIPLYTTYDELAEKMDYIIDNVYDFQND